MQSENKTKLALMEEWMKGAGIWWDTDLLCCREAKPSDTDSAGFGLWAAKGIKEDDHLCTIPKSALLSTRNTAIAGLLEAERLGGGLGLVFACMFERARSTSSPWHGYFNFLGHREFLPMFWPEDILQIAQGTCLDPEIVRNDAAAMREDFAHVEAVIARHPARFEGLTADLDWGAFQVAASWVSSRAFYVDAYHGQCLVPLADIFNHKAAVVEVGAGFRVAELDDASDDDEAGSADGEAGDKSDAEAPGDAEAGRDDAGGSGDGPPVKPASDALDAAPQRAKRPRGEAAADGSGTSEDEDGGDDEGGCGAAKKQRVGCDKPEGSGAKSHAEHADTAAGEGQADTGAGGTEGALNGEGEIAGAEERGSQPGDATDAENVKAVEQLRKERLMQLEALLGINLGLEIAIIDVEVDEGVEEDEEEEEEEQEEEEEEEQEEDGDADAAAGKTRPEEGDAAAAAETGAPPHLCIVAAQAIRGGKEVHNTYGEYGTLELVYKHGFALRRNPFDAVAVEVAELRESCVLVLGDTAAADARMAAVAACLREAADAAEKEEGGTGGGTGGQEGATANAVKAIEGQLELFGPDCVEGLTDSYLVAARKAKGFMAFPLFAALWWVGVEEGVLEEAKAAGENVVLMAVTAVTAAMRESGEAVGDIIQEHVDLFWAAKALSETSRFVLLGVVAQKMRALDDCAKKLAKARRTARAHFGSKRADLEKTWQDCTRAEVEQSFVALERLVARDRIVLKAVEVAMG